MDPRLPSPPDIHFLRAHDLLSPLDFHFARTLQRIGGEERDEVLVAAALASRHVGHGHVCLDLPRFVAQALTSESGEPIVCTWMPLATWFAALRSSPLVAVEGSGNEAARPLVLDPAGRLYLQRYWLYQRDLGAAILARVGAAPDEVQLSPSVRTLLQQLFPPAASGSGPDWQRIAALAAIERRFCVISGGPGTGKTFTVVKILALLIEQALAGGQPLPRIVLVAPTGKAAARLTESILATKGRIDCSEAVRAAIPEEAATIHRCLGMRRGSSTRVRHDGDDPLLADVVLVDEASMVDVALMARLAEALPPAARLILLGDKDQLASVEAGAVLGDICNTGGARLHSVAFAAHVARITGDAIPLAPDAPAARGMGDCVVHLEHSYRYPAESGIGALARAVNRGDAEAALAVLASSSGDVSLVETGGNALDARVLEAAADGFSAYLQESDPARQLERLLDFRVLCAHRRGAHGVETINREIEAELTRRGLLDTTSGAGYRKRPILVTRNDYQLDLFNGDVGVLGQNDEGQRAAYFPSRDPSLRAIALSRLPPHETVFAMTVHKSQGSELGHVAVVLPPKVSPVLSRELLYTAVSRARDRVTLFASREVLRATIACRIERASGLRDLLWRAW